MTSIILGQNNWMKQGGRPAQPASTREANIMELDFGIYDLHAPLPAMYLARQRFERPPGGGRRRRGAPATARLRPAGRELRPGQQIAITAGSRGIHDLGTVLRAVVDVVRAHWAPSRSSCPPWAATAELPRDGQMGLLRDLGVTEASVGAPIRATMDVVPVGRPARRPGSFSWTPMPPPPTASSSSAGSSPIPISTAPSRAAWPR